MSYTDDCFLKQSSPFKKSILWVKCSDTVLESYRNEVLQKLSASISQSNQQDPNEINNALTQTLHSAAMKLPQGKFNKHAKPYWSPTLKADHTHARHLRRTWISEGRPGGHHHPSYLLYKEAKIQFRRQQRQHIF